MPEHVSPIAREMWQEGRTMSLIRLMYRSENAMNVAGTRILVHFHDIVSTARKKNLAAGICGFLMFDRHWFYQILEGETSATDAIFARICADTRHKNVDMLARYPIAGRVFADWSMASFLSENPSHPLRIKHHIQTDVPMDGPTLLSFAMDFVSQEADTA